MQDHATTLTCFTCDVPIRRKPSAICARNYCSRACRQVPRLSLNCAYCGLTFERYAVLTKGILNYCSNACRFQPRTTLIERFWRNVRKTETCWLWTGAVSVDGYGRFGGSGATRRMQQAHRVSWELHNGAILDGLWVLHDCPNGDNPRCVNPAHLWLGTAADNTHDMIKKGRAPSGEKHYMRLHPEKVLRGEQRTAAKLTDDGVRYARARLTAGDTMTAIARTLGVNRRAIAFVRDGVTWQHVE